MNKQSFFLIVFWNISFVSNHYGIVYWDNITPGMIFNIYIYSKGSGNSGTCKLFKYLTIFLPTLFDLKLIMLIEYLVKQILPTPGEAKAKVMPGRLYIHTK